MTEKHPKLMGLPPPLTLNISGLIIFKAIAYIPELSAAATAPHQMIFSGIPVLFIKIRKGTKKKENEARCQKYSSSDVDISREPAPSNKG